MNEMIKIKDVNGDVLQGEILSGRNEIGEWARIAYGKGTASGQVVDTDVNRVVP